jgi:hypothetical protein
MGNFYTNYTLRGPSQREVADTLGGRNAVVTPSQNGSLVVFDEQSDDQDQQMIDDLALRLSRECRCVVLAVLNHDDDIFWYRLYEDGELTDEYDSSPGYFDPEAEPSAPAGGDAQRLCAAFGATNVQEVNRILRRSSFDDDGYAFAFERHGDLVRSLALPSWAVGTAFASFERDEYPEGLAPEMIIKTK